MPLIRHLGLRKKERQKAGFTLTEIAITIGIVGLVLGAVWVAASQVIASSKMHTATQQLQAIVNNIRGAYAEQGGMVQKTAGAYMVQPLDELKVFPLEMRQNQSIATGVVFHPWNQKPDFPGVGNVFVSPDDCNAGFVLGVAEPCFDLFYVNLPVNVCAQLAQQVSQLGMGLEQVQINGASVAVAGGVAGVTGFPISASEAATNCSHSSVGGLSYILFIFHLKGGGS